jgi:hypothetical protein
LTLVPSRKDFNQLAYNEHYSVILLSDKAKRAE